VFNRLSDKLQDVFKKLKGEGSLTEKNIADAMREVKMALLEADVNFQVVKQFIARVKEKAVGQEVLKSISPGQQIVKVVHDELVQTLGGEAVAMELAKPQTRILMCGLQGSGKTTTTAKLALKYKKERPLLVAGDIYRPAAVTQLQILGRQLDIEVFFQENSPPEKICQAALKYAAQHNHGLVIMDTAGRLHIDTEMMAELERVRDTFRPTETLLVVDAMTGQDAVRIAQEFDQAMNIDGVVLSKLDGDARGGAALSMRVVTNKPIKFAGIGEKLSDLEVFHPDRIASRILGMGDVLTLVEKAAAAFDQEDALKTQQKILEDSFTFEDFLVQLKQLRKLGPLEQLMGMIPGMKKMPKVEEKDLGRVEAIICSMTFEERRRPKIINGSRRRRIALGSGTKVNDVNRLIKQFDEARKMMKKITKMGLGKGMPNLKGLGLQ